MQSIKWGGKKKKKVKEEYKHKKHCGHAVVEFVALKVTTQERAQKKQKILANLKEILL